MHVLPSHQPRPIKVAFLTPSLAGGGAERWVVSLAQQFLRGSACEPVGLAVLHNDNIDASLLTQARGAFVPRSPEVGHAVYFANESSAIECVRRATARAGVLISWGCPNLRELTAGLDVPVVEVAHSTADLPGQAQLVAHSMRGAHYWVAVSEAAATSFPEAERSRVVVISNGADVNRVLPKLGRAESRRNSALEDDTVIGWQGDKVNSVTPSPCHPVTPSCTTQPPGANASGSPGTIAIVSIGRLNPTKRPELLVAAMAHLPQHYRLIFVGENQQGTQQKLTEYARLFAPGRVSFTTVHEHLGDLFALADVFATASRVEAHSLALTEAWLAGIPTVACRIPVLEEFARRHGHMVFTAPCDPTPQELAAAIEWAAASGRNHPAVRHAQRVAQQHYTLAAMAGRWEQFLRSVLVEWMDHALYPPLNCVA